MSLENFQIPIVLIPELYKNSLVQLEDKQTSNNNIEVENIHYLGRNVKNILILVNDAEAVHLSDASLEFLGQILQACKMNLNDVAIVNQHHHSNVSFHKYYEMFQPLLIIDFGSNIKKWNPQFDAVAYQVVLLDHCKAISAHSLPEIASNPELKKQLWLSLKVHFKL